MEEKSCQRCQCLNKAREKVLKEVEETEENWVERKRLMSRLWIIREELEEINNRCKDKKCKCYYKNTNWGALEDEICKICDKLNSRRNRLLQKNEVWEITKGALLILQEKECPKDGDCCMYHFWDNNKEEEDIDTIAEKIIKEQINSLSD